MIKPNFSMFPNVYIHPGEACFSRHPIVVSTVLGSCISITMYSKKIKYAGISHCQLPDCKNCYSDCKNCSDLYKYVKCTIPHMIEKFENLQIQRKDIEVKIFGGADVLKKTSTEKRIGTVGKQNIEMAHEVLAKNNMPASIIDVGGQQGRKIFFLTETGEIFLSRLNTNG
jgi:chemotaxis protein CheD